MIDFPYVGRGGVNQYMENSICFGVFLMKASLSDIQFVVNVVFIFHLSGVNTFICIDFLCLNRNHIKKDRNSSKSNYLQQTTSAEYPILHSVVCVYLCIPQSTSLVVDPSLIPCQYIVVNQEPRRRHPTNQRNIPCIYISSSFIANVEIF